MTIGINTSLRTNRVTIIKDAIDNGGDEYSAGKLLIYSGTRPATGEAIDEYDNDLLVQFDLPYPCGTVSDGVLTFSAIETALVLESGVATWARLVDADDDFVADFSVAVAGDVRLDDIELFKDDFVRCTLATITEGNA
jgi:hypothetical protein